MDVRSDWQSGNAFVKTNLVMLENEIVTDVQFSFPGSLMIEKIKAHKFILMSRSSVFFTMFSSGLQDTNQDIIIQDIMPSMFRTFLRFLYGDAVEIKETDALHLLYTAEKYAVTTLKDKCVQFLAGNISKKNVVCILEHALLYNVDSLSQQCLEFLSSLNGVVIPLQHYQVSKTTLDTILDCEMVKLSISEVDVFKTCNAWAHGECVKRKIASSAKNRRQVLGDTYTKIPFQSMTIDDFASHVSPARILTLEEEVEIYRILGKSTNVPNQILTNVDPVEVRIPGKVNIDYHMSRLMSLLSSNTRQSPDFWIQIECRKQFRILGFSFKKEGNIDVKINSAYQSFFVSQPSANTYMDEASVTKYKHVIASRVHRFRAERGAVPFSVSCRDGQFEFTGKAYNTNSLPFHCLLVEFPDGDPIGEKLAV